MNLTGVMTGNLTLDATTGSWNMVSGTLKNGTFTASGGAGLSVTSGIFDTVAINSPVDVSPVNNSNLTFKNGLVLNSTINVGKADTTTYGQVYFGDSTAAPSGSLSGTGTILFGGSTNNNVYNYSNSTGATSTLTIGGGDPDPREERVGDERVRGRDDREPGDDRRGRVGRADHSRQQRVVREPGDFVGDERGDAVTYRGVDERGERDDHRQLVAVKLGSPGDAWVNLDDHGDGSTVTLGGNFTQAAVGTSTGRGAWADVVGTLTGNLGLSAATGRGTW